MLAAGTARVDITPPLGIAHAGWGAQSHEGSEGIDMPLTITALVIEQDGNVNSAGRIVILDIDTCMLVERYDNAIRKAVTELNGIPPGNQRVSYTHTHSGPIEGLSWIVKGAEMVEPWFASMAPASASGMKSVAALDEEKTSQIGQKGVADSVLRPSGRALFGNEMRDVMTEGDLIEAGTCVRIIGHSGSTAVVVAD